MTEAEHVARIIRDNDLLAEAIKERNRELRRALRLNARRSRQDVVEQLGLQEEKEPR